MKNLRDKKYLQDITLFYQKELKKIYDHITGELITIINKVSRLIIKLNLMIKVKMQIKQQLELLNY